MSELYFVSNNLHKYSEIKSMSNDKIIGLDLKFCKQDIIEIQDEKIENIAMEKAKSAYNIITKPILIEDDGLFINSLNGFPGQYSKFILKSIGNIGIISILKGSSDRSAFFKSIFVYNDGITAKVFYGKINGKISSTIREGGWGYDPIFIPLNRNNKKGITFAKLSQTNKKNELSHRRIAFYKFIKWFNQNNK
jgi:XTP/dITP diphosphohydrolase